jgi:hypothetical protein
MMLGVSTLHFKQYGEYQLSAINNSGESIKMVSSNSTPNSKSCQIPSEGLERRPFLKKNQRHKIS